MPDWLAFFLSPDRLARGEPPELAALDADEDEAVWPARSERVEIKAAALRCPASGARRAVLWLEATLARAAPGGAIVLVPGSASSAEPTFRRRPDPANGVPCARVAVAMACRHRGRTRPRVARACSYRKMGGIRRPSAWQAGVSLVGMLRPGSPTERLVIREPLLPEEGEAILALFEETGRWHAERWPQDIRMPNPDGIRAELSELEEQDGSGFLLVADAEGIIVGLASAGLSPAPNGGLNFYSGPIMHIGDVVVTEAARRQGVGRRLMEELERRARERGAATIMLSLHVGNEAAQALYTSCGYRFTDVNMRKDL